MTTNGGHTSTIVTSPSISTDKHPSEASVDDNQYRLDATRQVLTLATGELGVADKIVGYIQDYLRLDALEQIKTADHLVRRLHFPLHPRFRVHGFFDDQMSCCIIYSELQKLVDLQIEDKEFIVICLKLLGTDYNRKRFSFHNKRGLQLILDTVERYHYDVEVQKQACGLFRGTFDLLAEKSHYKPILNRLLRALQEHQDDEALVEAALIALSSSFPGSMVYFDNTQRRECMCLLLNNMSMLMHQDNLRIVHLSLSGLGWLGETEGRVLATLIHESSEYGHQLNQVLDRYGSNPAIQDQIGKLLQVRMIHQFRRI